MKAQLTILDGKQKGRTIDLTEPVFLIGRGERCHLRPSSGLVSREHAEFAIKGNSLIVRDMGSRNGTLLNGKALTAPKTLKDGDHVQVGPWTFAVSLQGADQATARPDRVDRGEAKPDPVSPTVDADEGGHGDSTIMIPAFRASADSSHPGLKKKTAKASAASKAKAAGQSDGGSEILRKLMDRRKAKK